MKITKIDQVEKFLEAVNKCKEPVWLMSQDGDKYNLKSYLSQYIAIGALLSEHGDELELWCDSKDDENNFREFFAECPEVIDIHVVA